MCIICRDHLSCVGIRSFSPWPGLWAHASWLSSRANLKSSLIIDMIVIEMSQISLIKDDLYVADRLDSSPARLYHAAKADQASHVSTEYQSAFSKARCVIMGLVLGPLSSPQLQQLGLLYGERAVAKEAKCGVITLILSTSRQICVCGSHANGEVFDEGPLPWKSDQVA